MRVFEIHLGVHMSDDPIMDEIMSATSVLRSGDVPGGRSRLEAIWERICSDPEPIHEVALAHAMADAQSDPSEELAWDLRALDAALRCSDTEARQHSQVSSVAGFMPSLYTNLAEDYFRLGDFNQSRDHLESARGFLASLGDDAYGQLIRRGIERLAAQMEATGR